MATQDLARLVVRLEAQSAQLLTELEKANKKIDRFASQTTKTLNKWAGGLVGIFSARAMAQFSKQVIDSQAALVDMAAKSGTTVENLSSLGYAASQSGSDLQTLDAGLKGIAKTSTEAAKGSESASAALDALDVSATNADGSLKDSSDLLLEIADKFAQYEDGAAKATLAQELFGKAGRDLIPLLNKGAAGIQELQKEATALGITVSTQTAQAASAFNDELSKIGAVTRGVVGAALADLLPVMKDFASGLTEGEGAAARLDTASRVLATGLRLLASGGVIIAEIFDRAGDVIGATVAAIVAVMQADFRGALNIQKDFWTQSAASVGEAAGAIAKIWDDNAKGIVTTAQTADEALKKTLVFGGKKGASGVQEVNISLQKIEAGPMEEFYKRLDDMTKTSTEKAVAAYHEQLAALDFLYSEGIIKAEQYNARLAEIQTGTLGLEEVEITVKKVKETTEKATTELTEFQKQAARNTQDIISDALINGFDAGAQGILDSFYSMITELAAQAVAANLSEKLFGKEGAGGGGGGWLDTAFNWVSTFFGGTRDSGGRGEPGKAYAIGTGAQPEVFVPDSAGTFYPRGEGMGRSLKLTQNIYTTGRVDQRSARQLELEALRRQRAANAALG